MYVCAIRIVLVHSWFLVILRCLWWVTTHKSDSWAAACKTGPTATLGISSRKAPPGAQGAGTGDWPAHELFSMDFKWFHYKTNSINSSPIWSRAQEIQMQLASICLGLHRSVEPSLMCLRLGTQDAIRKPGLPEKEWNSLHGMLEIVYPCVDIYEYIYIYLSLSLSLSRSNISSLYLLELLVQVHLSNAGATSPCLHFEAVWPTGTALRSSGVLRQLPAIGNPTSWDHPVDADLNISIKTSTCPWRKYSTPQKDRKVVEK